MRNIRQNLFFAFIYNALGVPIAAGVLYPVFGLLLSPMIAAAAMSAELGLGDRQRAAPAHGEGLRVLPRFCHVAMPGVPVACRFTLRLLTVATLGACAPMNHTCFGVIAVAPQFS